ncbi:MAG: polyribonucleotide nucleotidyltransferase [Patescibacteria group bacterium]|nr:polyribonucleotide nucleotidyltransferase [Patescibacteria group bacterium]MDE2217912.1 polyribonucleotide nucleotidyltransferase [Patescibacteria group bacterium]
MEVGGKKLTAIFSDLAEQSNGSVMIKYGNTVVLATAVMSTETKDGLDYFPLIVDYEERFYAGGRILGSRFVRREGKPSDEAILSGRMVDRTIRPLFEKHIRNEVQVVITILSLDEYDPDVLGVIGASLALGISDIPWEGPVSAVRIGKQNGSADFEINPSYNFRNDKNYNFDLVACGKDGNINMIEVGANEAKEEAVSKALEKASEEIEKIQEFQKKIIAEIGKEKKVVEKPKAPDGLEKIFEKKIEGKLYDCVFSQSDSKDTDELKKEWLEIFKEKLSEENLNIADSYFEKAIDDLVHKEAIDNGRRPDGRGVDEIRPIYAEAGGISPVLHGSGIFYRGGTHVLSVATLGGPQDSQIIDSMEEQQTDKRFIHHYNFPPFSTGETGKIGGTNRRMIGHGALAEKALSPVIPSQEQFPYTIRIVSESMASNGSTSMASVCGGTIALMDAGVPIKAPVAGIASGLMMRSPTEYKVLTDIQGYEDHHGDMDFKVAGTRDGITAIQMDIKVSGIPIPIIAEALEKARTARLHILDKIESAIRAPRKEISPNAPRVVIIKIKPDQIGLVIGAGGKTVNEIKDKTGAEIDIENDGAVFITGKNDSAARAQKIIEEMTREYKIGEKFEGEVTKIFDFGALVRIAPNVEGLVHISEIAPFRIDRIDKIINVGEKVAVVIKEVDEVKKKISLSIKDIDPNFTKRKGLV